MAIRFCARSHIASAGFYKSIQTALSEPQKINERKYFCTVSGGAVFFPQFGKDYLVLHKYAEAALSFAKQRGKNKNVLFSKELYNRWLRSLTAHEDIRRSVEDDCRGFSLCFQPQVHAVDQRIIGAEALLRWQNSKGRMVDRRYGGAYMPRLAKACSRLSHEHKLVVCAAARPVLQGCCQIMRRALWRRS